MRNPSLHDLLSLFFCVGHFTALYFSNRKNFPKCHSFSKIVKHLQKTHIFIFKASKLQHDFKTAGADKDISVGISNFWTDGGSQIVILS